MATTRNSKRLESVGAVPPFVSWTMVRGDTASFKAYVTDDAKQPLDFEQWSISMKVKRPNSPVVPVVITDDAELILTATPAPELDELPGYFTTSLTSSQTNTLETGCVTPESSEALKVTTVINKVNVEGSLNPNTMAAKQTIVLDI